MQSNKVILEIVWWALTLVLIVLILLPIYSKIGTRYPFYVSNIAFIIISTTFIRYIFLLKHHWLSSAKWIKVLFVFIPIPIFFYLTGAFYDFQSFSDEVSLTSLVQDIPYKEQIHMTKYMRVEMVFFFAAAFIANLMMPLRMVISLWREINKGTH